jgi:hypothetical protein
LRIVAESVNAGALNLFKTNTLPVVVYNDTLAVANCMKNITLSNITVED